MHTLDNLLFAELEAEPTRRCQVEDARAGTGIEQEIERSLIP